MGTAAVERSAGVAGGDRDIVEGTLLCSNRMCQREHPIVDGIPIVVADIAVYVNAQLANIAARDDLSAFTDSVLGDAAGPGSQLDTTRYQLSTYARGHWGDLDRELPAARAGGMAELFDVCMGALEAPPAGVWLDVGCSVGRALFELTARTGDLAVGVDLNFAMLRTAARALRDGVVRYPLRRVGLVYDRREHRIDVADREVTLWACDAAWLPFPPGQLDGATSFNVLDCISLPHQHLVEVGRVLRPGAEAVFTTPYDWSAGATSLDRWIGGHSQRSAHGGSSVAEVRRLLADGAPSGIDPLLRITRELDDVPWRVYVHERAAMDYRLHALITRRTDG